MGNSRTGLSMAARATPVRGPAEMDKALHLLAAKYPEYTSLPMPEPGALCTFRVAPMVISVFDYAEGFGHADLVVA
jgi:hypothetical protein